MIATITLNPAVDKCYKLEDLIKGNVIRAKKVENSAGGKGLNVSKAIKLLGEDIIATGFLGGKTGEFIAEELKKINIENRFTIISEETRNCLAFITDDFSQTEILEPGPEIKDIELKKLLYVYDELLNEAEIICASGSLPKGIDSSLYGSLIERANNKNIKFLLDTSGEALIKGIEKRPFFIKPNIEEFIAITGESINNDDEIAKATDKFYEKGIKFIIVSLGKDGAIANFFGKKYRVRLPKVKAINPVGSGDSMVAGVAVALKRNYEIKELLAFASACGTANAMEEKTGFVDVVKVNELKNKVIVEEI